MSALILTIDRVYGLFAVLMLLSAVGMLLLNRAGEKPPLLHIEKLFIAAMLAYPLAIAVRMLIDGHWQGDQFDNPSRFLLVLTIFFAVRRFGFSRNGFYIGLILGAIGAGCFGYYQKYVLLEPVAHGHILKIEFGDISLMLGALALTAWVPSSHNSALNKWLLRATIIGFAFGLLGSITSGTRGGWLAVPLMLWLILREAIPSHKIRLSIYASFIFAVLATYHSNDLVKFKVDKAVNDFATYAENHKQVQGSVGTRFEMWRGALLMFSESPLLGVGVREYRAELNELITQDIIHPSVRRYNHAHSDILHIAAELGLLGITAFAVMYGLLVYFFMWARQYDRQLAVAGLILVFGFIDFGLSQAMFKHTINTTFLGVYAALLAGGVSYVYYTQSAKMPLNQRAA